MPRLKSRTLCRECRPSAICWQPAMALRDGQCTRTVYQHIKEKNYGRAIELLEPILQVPSLVSHRAALVLSACQMRHCCNVHHVPVTSQALRWATTCMQGSLMRRICHRIVQRSRYLGTATTARGSSNLHARLTRPWSCTIRTVQITAYIMRSHYGKSETWSRQVGYWTSSQTAPSKWSS